MAKETYTIKKEWNLDHQRYDYHIYSSRTGFVITCESLKQVKRFIAICEGDN